MDAGVIGRNRLDAPPIEPQGVALTRRIGFVLLVTGALAFGVLPTAMAAVLDVRAAGRLATVHLLIVIGLAAYLGRRDLRAAVLVLALILAWQPLLTMPIVQTTGGTGVKMFVATKEFYITILLTVMLLRNSRGVRWNLADLAALGFLALTAFYSMYSSGAVFGRLVSARENFMIVAFYLVGRLSRFDGRDLRWMLQMVAGVALLVAAFGYLERFVFDGGIWTAFGAQDYVRAKFDVGGYEPTFIAGMPAQWHTYVAGEPVRRMVGPIGDATALSRFLALPILGLIYIRDLVSRDRSGTPIRWALVFFLAGAMILTLGRGGQVIVLGGVFAWLLYRRPLLAIVAGVPAGLLLLLRIALFDLSSGSMIRHLSGAASGLAGLTQSPLGHGLGTSGQMALFYSTDVTARVGESYLGSTAYQMGLPGLAGYFGFFLLVSWLLFRAFRRLPRRAAARRYVLLGLALNLGIFITSLLANSAVAPISAGLALLYIGAVMGWITAFPNGEVRAKPPVRAAAAAAESA